MVGDKCFSTNATGGLRQGRRKENRSVQVCGENYYISGARRTTGSHYLRRGDHRQMIRNSEPIRARESVPYHLDQVLD